MHIFFSGIGGTGIGPLALIAKQAGHRVSGSDKQDSQYIHYLHGKGIDDIFIDQSGAALAEVHARDPIDWYVYSSALPRENPDHPELAFVATQHIKHSKRDLFLRHLLDELGLEMLAIAGTHGKTTTTAMAVWAFKSLNLPVSYSVGAKISFGDMGQYVPSSRYFVYECDEFDRNFLSYVPRMSLITGLAWDHHDIYPTIDDYRQAFQEFMDQSGWKVLWQPDLDFSGQESDDSYIVLPDDSPDLDRITLPGLVNRKDAWLVIQGLHTLLDEPVDKLVGIMNKFPGVSRRMEKIAGGLYSDYAHTPEKLLGGTQVALEIAREQSRKLVVVYEPLTNRRMHHTKEAHRGIFTGASRIYWVPSYLAREDPALAVMQPEELIPYLGEDLQAITSPMKLDDALKHALAKHLSAGDMVVCFSGGGGNSLDEWLRNEFA